MTQNTEWSPGICARLFETVKPETVVLHSLEIHRYEVLLDAKSVVSYLLSFLFFSDNFRKQ